MTTADQVTALDNIADAARQLAEAARALAKTMPSPMSIATLGMAARLEEVSCGATGLANSMLATQLG